jgi:hypothetical protein
MSTANVAIHEQIYEKSRPGYAPNASVVDSLLKARWVHPDDLVEAFNVLEDGEPNRAIFFAQLSLEIRLPNEWIRLPSELGDPHLFPRIVGTVLNDVDSNSEFTVSRRKRIADSESFTNARLPFDPYGLLIRTQLLVSFKLTSTTAQPASSGGNRFPRRHRLQGLVGALPLQRTATLPHRV